MIELQKYVVGVLKSVHSRVYQEEAPQEAVYPFVVYRLPTSTETEERREDFILEVDVWDNPPDGSTVTLQQLADEIDRALHRTVYLDPGGKWITMIYRINRMMVPDPDPEIRRRQLRYDLRTYAV